jgi:hypothetical protein
MNKINLEVAPGKPAPQAGDIYADPFDGAVYILARVGICTDMYVAVDIATGTRWDEVNTVEEAVDGLEFVGRDLKITIAK